MEYKNYYLNQDEWWDSWKGHRQTISDLILQKVLKKELGIKNVAIFGAGHCNDIDLNFLTDNFEVVTLLDISKDIMLEGVNRQSLTKEKLSKIQFIGEVDFVGQTQDIYNKFEELLNNKTPIKKVVKFLRETANYLDRNDTSIEGMWPHSVVIAVGVHSQLSNLQVILNNYCKEIEGDKNNYSPKEIAKIAEEMRYYYNIITKKFNNTLIKYTEKVMFLGFDIIEISKSLGNEEYLEYAYKCLVDNDFCALSSLITRNGVCGALEGYLDIIERTENKKLNNSLKPVTNFWNWEFDNDKTYIVYSITVLKECLDI